MKYLLSLLFSLFFHSLFAQRDSLGIMTGNIMDEKSKALEGATVQLILLPDSSFRKTSTTDAGGEFNFDGIGNGYYRIHISFVGFQPKVIDSIHFRADRKDFNLADLVLLSKTSSNLQEVIIYAEKPLIQSKDGNITFNAAESALSAGSNASELLTNVPLVTKDPDGKLLVRGKEPKILIDDKPVELNQQQLQDLLESMPGSAIEKIEVMTNPPPQYANEQGGVINITTRKGRVGKTGRLNLSLGTRGEASLNGNFSYRKNAFALTVNGGAGYNQFIGEGYSNRQNLNADSLRYYNTNGNDNKALRPNLRVNADYDFNKFNALNLTFSYNRNDFDNQSEAQFNRFNKRDTRYYLRERLVNSKGSNFNPNLSVSYTKRTKRPGETLKLIASVNYSNNNNTRDFYEQFLNPADFTFSGNDSTQQVFNDNRSKGYNFRANYDLPLKNKKTFLSVGGFHNIASSHIETDANYLKKTDGKWTPLEVLNNEFFFDQTITNLRASARQVIMKDFSTTAGVSAERTNIHFDLVKAGMARGNSYWNFLPFANLNRNWREKLNLTVSYRRSIRRPGVNELNPTVDVSDSNNIRYGNPELQPTLTHNFDLVLGKTTKAYFLNIGMGFNRVINVFNQIRVTANELTYQNISSKREYELSTWNGYTISKAAKINLSASYTHNQYSRFDKTVRRFRDGSSFTSNVNANYTWRELYNATSSFTFNRFANPQGTVRSTMSMNLGVQAKMLQKRATVTLNIIDPFRQQNNRTFTYGPFFTVENYSATQTRNLRLSLAYNFTKPPPKKKAVDKNKQQLQKAVQQAKAKQ
ncbi:MAG: hypothetical protein JWP69_701 [Flaviaesturariibacter sp.]|nr:hypothetical protein [Flaviaesturariibacter sp.]